jgi:hypothetical protein
MTIKYLIRQNPLGRWYIADPEYPDKWGWSGSRWVDCVEGIGLVVQVANFESEEDARAYAREWLDGKR